jgi:hypothetical protein
MKAHHIVAIIAILALGMVILTYLSNEPSKTAVRVEVNTTLVKQSSFDFEGHRYMIMEWTLGRTGPELSGTQLIHDPDCPCKNKK